MCPSHSHEIEVQTNPVYLNIVGQFRGKSYQRCHNWLPLPSVLTIRWEDGSRLVGQREGTRLLDIGTTLTSDYILNTPPETRFDQEIILGALF